MRSGVGRWAGVLFLALVSALCWLDLASSGPDRSPPSPRAPAAWGELTSALPSTRTSVRLPNPILGFAALTADARTSLVGLHPNGTQPLMEPEVMDGGSIVVRGSELAYLLLPGLDSSQNYLEARNLADGPRWKILPGEGGVIFGFAMDPSGSHLAYLEVDSRPSGTLVPWRVVAVDLASGARRAILDGARDGDIPLLPLDWAHGIILLRGLTPFSPHFHGLWTVMPDGSDLRKLLDESDYVATPRLSPQGDRLALLRAEPGVRPPISGPGEPSATVIEVLTLSTGLRIPILVTDARHEFTELQWAAGDLLVVQGEWDDEQHAFLHRRVLRLTPEANSSPEDLYSAADGDILRLARCPNESWLVAIREGHTTHIVQRNQTEPVASFQEGELDYMACLAESVSGSVMAKPGALPDRTWSKARP